MSPIVLLIDYLLGIVMWTLIGRSAMRIFLPENSTFFFNRAFIKMTDPFVKMFRFITPQFIVAPLIPIYVAWFFLYDSILSYALDLRIFSHGNVIFSSRK